MPAIEVFHYQLRVTSAQDAALVRWSDKKGSRSNCDEHCLPQLSRCANLFVAEQAAVVAKE